MKKFIPLLFSILLLTTVLTAGCATGSTLSAVTFEQLFASPEKYNGKNITIEGYYYHGWETIVLAESLELSGYSPGHLVPKGRMVWIEGGIPIDIYNRLYKQQMMGPEERYGKVKISGKFEYGGQYGHLGAFNAQVTPVSVEICYIHFISQTLLCLTLAHRGHFYTAFYFC